MFGLAYNGAIHIIKTMETTLNLAQIIKEFDMILSIINNISDEYPNNKKIQKLYESVYELKLDLIALVRPKLNVDMRCPLAKSPTITKDH